MLAPINVRLLRYKQGKFCISRAGLPSALIRSTEAAPHVTQAFQTHLSEVDSAYRSTLRGSSCTPVEQQQQQSTAALYSKQHNLP